MASRHVGMPPHRDYKRMIKFLIASVFTLTFSLNSWGQINLQGQIKDEKGEALSNINILIYLPNSKALIAYAVSNEKGQFRTEVNAPSDSLDIELSSIHFRKEYRRIPNITQNLLFELVYDTKQLEAFTVKAAAIEKRGDTLSFLVSTFAGKEDRAIEDVLRRMPGIDIEPNGQILYQGLPLQKFYVEGLDLMSGRYGVITKNLPHRTVSSVEILENHQPLKILEERVYSQQASLNLKLKRDITTTGTGRLGIGATPMLWDINLTPMTFTKNFQLLTSYQTNNAGKDVSKQLNVLTLEDLNLLAGRPDEKAGILNIQSASPPQIEQHRFLNNKIHYLNFNALLKMNRDFQLRANLYYVVDEQKQESSLFRNLFTPSDTLNFSEYIDNKINEKYLMGEFTLSRNVKKNYLNNQLKIKSRWDEKLGLVNTENQDIRQSLKNPLKSISNDLRSVNAIGKQLIEFQSYLSYNHNPYSLEVKPGQFEGVLNEGLAFDKIYQEIDLKRFYADHSASFGFGLKRWSFTPKLGVVFRKQTLESNIFITEQEQQTEAGAGFINNFEGNNTHAYLQTKIQYKKDNLTLNINLPFSWQQTSLKDLSSSQGQEIDRFLFDPRLSVNYKYRNFWRIYGLWAYVNRLGDMDQTHYAYILKSYRNLSKNAAPLSEITFHNFSASLSYRNPISSFFNSLAYVYSISKNNLIYSSTIQNDGTSIVEASHLPNTAYSHNVNGSSSKYFAAIKSTISMRFNYSHRKGISLMNEVLFNTTSQFCNLKPGFNYRATEWLNFEYELDATYIKTFIEKEQKSKIEILRHKFNFFAFPTRNQLISLSSEYYELQGKQNFFADLLYRYTFTKNKIDLEFRWNNLFNTKTYTNYQASAFTVYESSYMLRPSQVFVSVKFSF